DLGVRERRPDRRVHDRALTRVVRLRNPPLRGRRRGPRGPGAGPRGADAAGDPPDLRSPGAVTVYGYRAEARWRCGAFTTIVRLRRVSRTITRPRATRVSVPSHRSIVSQRALLAVAVL